MGHSSEGWASAELEALTQVRAFILKARRLIESISVEDLVDEGGVNPYMAKALGMRTVEEVVEFFVGRRVERSLGTSFGNVLDNAIRILLGGARGRELTGTYGAWISWWDVVLPDRGVVISVKSGPADMDKDQVEYFAQRAREAEGKGFRPFLAFAYGKRAFPIIESYLRKRGLPPEEYLRVGKDVFREFLADPLYYRRALRLFSAAGEGAGDIFTLIEGKTRELAAELKKRYGDDVNRMLEDMF